MGSRQALHWLVIDCLPAHPTLLGAPLAIFGHARYDGDGDLLTVTTPAGQRDTTQVGRFPMQELAKQLLRELHRKDAGG